MKLSVLIPVYKAENFIEEAVLSALKQPETKEIVLVEDGSPDNSLRVCKGLNDKYDKVKLFRHPNGENRGAGASRNLAIEKATCEIIAFLDADDFFLPNRFATTTQIFEQDETIDGVCEAVGFHYQDLRLKNNKDNTKLTTMTKHVPPAEMFFKQAPIGSCGYCPTPGWTVHKRLFERSGFFDEHLHLHQDTALFVKFTAIGKIVPGQIEKAVSMRRVHSNNRITAPRSPEKKYHDRLHMWETLFDWGRINLPYRKTVILFKKWINCYLSGPENYAFKNKRLLDSIVITMRIPKFILYALAHIFICKSKKSRP